MPRAEAHLGVGLLRQDLPGELSVGPARPFDLTQPVVRSGGSVR